MQIMTVDIETYSPIDLFTAGAYRYAQSPDFQILLLSYTIDNGPVVTFDLVADTIPDEDRRLLVDPGIIKRAHNAAFEWWCLSQHFGLDARTRSQWLEQWQDTMVHMLYCGLPASLDNAGKALQLPTEAAKMREGKALITYFCKPCKPTKSNGGRIRNMPWHDPDKWALFTTYNGRDVTAEREIDRKLGAFPVPEEIWRQWRDDLRMNANGIGVDLDLARGAMDCAEQITERLTAEAKALSRLDNPNSPVQLMSWLQGRGVRLDSITKDTVAHLLARKDTPADAHRMLEIRQQISKTSNAKYDAVIAATGDDSRIRGTMQFYGAARTGRWAGRLLQVQNLPRTHLEHQDDIRRIIKLGDADSLEAIYGDVNDTLSQMIRTVLVPQQDAWFIDADFSAIEARLIAWEAGEDWVLDVFRSTGRIYEATAARIFGIPEDRIRKGNPEYEYRQRGKVATLALGYQGSVGAMKRMGGDRLGLDDAGLQDIVDRWREQNPHIIRLWRKMQRAAVRTISTGHPTSPRPGVVFRIERGTAAPFAFLTMEIPSGRKLFYANPGTTEDGRITYWEQDTTGWAEAETYGGKLTENLTQALGRDCLQYALTNLRAAGYAPVFHVHDEVIVESATQKPEEDLKTIIKIMSQVPPWAEGLPLNADGWYGKFYTKE